MKTSLPKRKSIRLSQYNYAENGAYFITICTKGKQKVLCDIVGAGLCARPQVRLTYIGEQVKDVLSYISQKHTGVLLDTYVIMRIDRVTGGRGDPPLHKILGEFKSYTTHLYGEPLWQRSFYDHVIRGEADYREIAEYIENNPAKWQDDRFCL